MSSHNLFQAAVNKKNKIDVFINDQTNPLFQYFLVQELKTDITLTSTVAKDAEIIPVSAGHGFTAVSGEMITIFDNNRYIQSRVVSVSTNDITVETPTAFALTTNAVVIRGNRNINQNASVTPIEFLFQLRNYTIPIDISKIIIIATHAAAGDYSKFTGITKLINGMWFRKENDIDFNLGNYQINEDFRLKGASVDFPDKAPSGTYATEIVFDMVDIFGQVMRFYPAIDDLFKGTSRDDLSSITTMTISLIGSYTDE